VSASHITNSWKRSHDVGDIPGSNFEWSEQEFDSNSSSDDDKNGMREKKLIYTFFFSKFLLWEQKWFL